MALEEIILGPPPRGEGGDTPRAASVKINAMMKELYELIGKLQEEQTTDDILEGVTNLFFKEVRVRSTKLDGLNFNSTGVISAADSLIVGLGRLGGRLETAFARSNHTGTQPISTVADLQKALDDILAVANAKMKNPMTRKGDIILGGTSGIPLNLYVGTDSQVLTVVNGEPAWKSLPPSPLVTIDYLVVGGGGAGGSATTASYGGGGGGGGGIRLGSMTAYQGSTYAVVVGAGGGGVSGSAGGDGNKGGASSFDTVSAAGGGGGGGYPGAGGAIKDGASGGGGTSYVPAGGGSIAGQGANGGTGAQTGGGGGGSVAGGNATATQAGAGGAGSASTISGVNTFYGGGGGGAGGNSTNLLSGAGGNGGGGAGGGSAGSGTTGASGQSGAANTGGGGGGQNGGAGSGSGTSGAGGTGIVIVRYQGAQRATGGIVTSAGGYTTHKFTSSGSFVIS